MALPATIFTSIISWGYSSRDLLHRCLDVVNLWFVYKKVKVTTPSPNLGSSKWIQYTHSCTLLILPHHLEDMFFPSWRWDWQKDSRIHNPSNLELGGKCGKLHLALGRTNLSFGHYSSPFSWHLVFCCCIFVWSLETNQKPLIKQLFAYTVKSPKYRAWTRFADWSPRYIFGNKQKKHIFRWYQKSGSKYWKLHGF